MFYTIYKITNLVNNKIYIGMHQTKKLEDGYMGSGTSLRSAFKKYGMHNFTKEIMFILNNRKDMIEKEKELVTEEFCNLSYTYNMCIGGHGGAIRKGAILSEETKLKISEKTKEAMSDENLKKRLSEKRKLRKTSNETKQLMSDMRTGKIWITSPDKKSTKHIHQNEADILLSNGWTLGREFKNHMKDPEKAAEAGLKRRKSVTIDNIVYGDYKQAAIAIGRSPSYVQSLIKKGKAFFGPSGSGF